MMQQKFNIPTIYESLDAAVTNSPDNAVFDIAVPGKSILNILKKIPPGRGVLIQKPMGETLEEAKAILDLCREKELKAAINFQMRFAPYIIAARDMIAQGLIGDVHDMEVRMQVYMPWQLWDFMLGIPRLEILYHSIHYIDLVRSFLGTPDGVYAKTLKHPFTAHLAATRTMMMLDYGEAVRVNIMTNHGHIYGSEKQQSYVKWEGTKGAIQVQAGLNMNYPEGRPDKFEYVLLSDNEPDPQWQQVDINGSWFPEAFIGTMASLMRYVNDETDDLPTSVEDAIMTMATVEAAYISSAGGGTHLPTLERDSGR
jgi:predicted dehydrogenase